MLVVLMLRENGASCEAVIFDCDETLISGAHSDNVKRREEGLVEMLKNLVKAGKKLFIISGADPAPGGLTEEEWLRKQKERKINELTATGIEPSLFEELFVAIPTPGITLEQLNTDVGLVRREYVASKQTLMEKIISNINISAGKILSLGDRKDLEGEASKRLGLDFIELPPACSMLPTDTLCWILKTEVLGQNDILPAQIREYDANWLRNMMNTDPLIARSLYYFNEYFVKYVNTRLWGLLELLKIPLPELEATNFNRYEGDLTSACNAAEQLVEKYDLFIGIARKGLWLSCLFSLYTEKVREIYLFRNGDERIYCPISEMWKKDVYGKKVLILDNDALTGKSIKVLAENLKKNGVAKVDALLIYSHTEPKQLTLADIWNYNFLDVPRVLGRKEGGKLVLDSRPQLRQIRALDSFMTLEHNFKAKEDSREVYKKIKTKLGV